MDEEPIAAPVPDSSSNTIDTSLPSSSSPSPPSPLFYLSPRFSESGSEHESVAEEETTTGEQSSLITPSTTLVRERRRGFFAWSLTSKLFVLSIFLCRIVAGAALLLQDGFLLAVSGLGMVWAVFLFLLACHSF
jgi:hypothetical protein